MYRSGHTPVLLRLALTLQGLKLGLKSNATYRLFHHLHPVILGLLHSLVHLLLIHHMPAIPVLSIISIRIMIYLGRCPLPLVQTAVREVMVEIMEAMSLLPRHIRLVLSNNHQRSQILIIFNTRLLVGHHITPRRHHDHLIQPQLRPLLILIN